MPKFSFSYHLLIISSVNSIVFIKKLNIVNNLLFQHVPDTPESSKSDLHHLVSDDEDSARNQKTRSTIPMASFNFINSIIGSGIIGNHVIVQSFAQTK